MKRHFHGVTRYLITFPSAQLSASTSNNMAQGIRIGAPRPGGKNKMTTHAASSHRRYFSPSIGYLVQEDPWSSIRASSPFPLTPHVLKCKISFFVIIIIRLIISTPHHIQDAVPFLRSNDPSSSTNTSGHHEDQSLHWTERTWPPTWFRRQCWADPTLGLCDL